jgi:hypothetical protein
VLVYLAYSSGFEKQTINLNFTFSIKLDLRTQNDPDFENWITGRYTAYQTHGQYLAGTS